MFNLTNEQSNIIKHISLESSHLTMVSSVAGSGKTTLLTAIASSLPNTNSLYLAYNKSIATEAKKKFPKTVNCVTTHSLAYQATVRPYKLRLGVFNAKAIKESMKYSDKQLLVDLIREFFLSKFTSFEAFAEENELSKKLLLIAKKYISLMEKGEIECSHEFYLKFFHILLSKELISYNEFDFIMLDEAGDLNEVTLEIFKLLPAKKKIMVGDPYQNIYTFNHTINCFEAMANEGTTFPMSQSFRVSEDIAEDIQEFCQTYLNPSMQFKGVPIKDSTIDTRAYITRTNGSLISRMIELNKDNVPYGLIRKANQIFELPLALCNLKYQGFISSPSYRFLQTDIDDWYENSELQSDYKTPLAYLRYLYEDDLQLLQALNLIIKHGRSNIIDCFNTARLHESKNHKLILGTAHTMKGLEADEVILAPDMNKSVEDAVNLMNQDLPYNQLSTTQKESLNLYYVACTRAKKSLIGAHHLKGKLNV